MLDATGKIGLEGGFFDGNMAAFGDFDECLRIDVAASTITINVTGKSLSEALFLLHQQTHNMTTNCSLNYKLNT